MYLKGKESAKQNIDNFKSKRYEIYTTIINITEYFMGIFKSNILPEEKMRSLKDFFLTLHPRIIDYEVGILAANLYASALRGQPIGWRDTFIAAIVLLNGKKIITSNTEHFRRIPDIKVIEFY